MRSLEHLMAQGLESFHRKRLNRWRDYMIGKQQPPFITQQVSQLCFRHEKRNFLMKALRDLTRNLKQDWRVFIELPPQNIRIIVVTLHSGPSLETKELESRIICRLSEASGPSTTQRATRKVDTRFKWSQMEMDSMESNCLINHIICVKTRSTSGLHRNDTKLNELYRVSFLFLLCTS